MPPSSDERSGPRPRRVREQAVVYLAEQDRALLERLVEETGLSRTELFRRGLRRLADDVLAADRKPGSSLEHLIEHAEQGVAPADLAARHDEYLYGGGYQRLKKKRAGSD